MPEIKVRIKWDKPDEPFWLNPDNVKVCLQHTCPNTKFEVEDLETKVKSSQNEPVLPLREMSKYSIKQVINNKDTY